jgi:hypothetical protein
LEEQHFMRRLIWLPIAGFLLIAGAAIAVAAAAPSATPSQAAFDASSPAPSAVASPGTNSNGGQPGTNDWLGHMPGAGPGADLLNQVLGDLVKAGTITQAQSDAITKALQQAVTDKQTQAQQQRQELQQEWTQIQGFLQDGTITQDEVNQLPADSPFRQAFNSIAQDGKVTAQQLQQLMRGFGMGPGMMPGHRFGPGPMMPGPWGPGAPFNNGGNGPNPQSSPSPSTTGTSS